MKAVIGYIKDDDRWNLIDVSLGDLSSNAETYTRCMIDKEFYTKIIDVEIKKVIVEDDGTPVVTLADGVILPKMQTLEERIQEHVQVLSAWQL